MKWKYNYRRKLPHIHKDNRPIFVTFTTAHRWFLPPSARDIALDCCLKENGRKINLHAVVVMPDHTPRSLHELAARRWLGLQPAGNHACDKRSFCQENQFVTHAQRACVAGRVLRSCAAIE